MSLKIWTEEKIALLTKGISDGLTYDKLAEQFSTTKEAVRKIIRRKNLPKPRGDYKPHKWTKEMVDKVMHLKLNGKKLPEIAKILGVTRYSIYWVAKKHNIGRNQYRTDWLKKPLIAEAIKRMFKVGDSNMEIGGQFGISPKYVCELARKLGVARTKEDIAKAHRKAKSGYIGVMRLSKFQNLQRKLSPIRYGSDMGYLVGALRGCGKCRCRSEIHYTTKNTPLIKRISYILSRVIGRNIPYHSRAKQGEKYYTHYIKFYCRELVTYLSMFINILKKRYPRYFGRYGLVVKIPSWADTATKKKFHYIPLDIPTTKRRRDPGWVLQKRWWPKWKKEFMRGFVQGVWDARGEVHFNWRTHLPHTLIVKVSDPYIAEYLIRAQRKLGVKNGSIKTREWKYRRGRYFRRYTVILQGRSIIQFAQHFRFPDVRRNMQLAQAVDIAKNTKRGFERYETEQNSSPT